MTEQNRRITARIGYEPHFSWRYLLGHLVRNLRLIVACLYASPLAGLSRRQIGQNYQ